MLDIFSIQPSQKFNYTPGCVGAFDHTKGLVLVHLRAVAKQKLRGPRVDQELLPVLIHLLGIQMPYLQVDVPDVFPLPDHLE